MPHTRRLWTALAAVGLTLAAAGALALASPGRSSSVATSSSAATGCQLSPNGQIKHLVNMQFDNTHFARDRADVPSDLEQMPHLLNFLTSNGTLFTNDHTILISHTAGGILSIAHGPLPGPNGQTVSNSYDYYRNNGDADLHLVVQVLDGAGGRCRRLEAEHDRRHGQEHARTVGAVHPRRL